MKCPVCTKPTQATFEGPQHWCTGCGRLFWMNPDGSVHDVYVPAVIAAHEICHDLDGNVGAGEYARGCEHQQRKLFGCAPDADRVKELESRVRELEIQNARVG